MSVSLALARRFLWAHRGYLFARLATCVAIGGVALSVFAMTLVLAVMGGFREHLEAKLLGFAPHIVITPAVGAEERIGTLLRQPPPTVAGRYRATRVVEGEAIIQRVGEAGFADQGVKVRGIDPADLALWKSVAFHFGEEGAEGLATGKKGPGVLLGNELLLNLGAAIEGSSMIRLIAPLSLPTPAGELGPTVREYRVVGALQTGFYEHDTKLVITTPAEAERLLGAQAEAKWFLYGDRPMAAAAIARELTELIGADGSVATWEVLNRKLLGALRLERTVMTILLILMVVIASLSICGVVLMQVAWRRRDLAMLAALGSPLRQRLRIVLHLGTWIGCLGSLVGLAAALGVGGWLQRYPLRLPSSFYLDHLPVVFHPLHCVGFGIIGISIAMLAALWPAYQAGRSDPIEELRYE